MSREAARNVAIVVLLALVVWLAPGGGAGAMFVQQLLSAIFIALMGIGLGMLYRNFRPEIYSLGDNWRLGLYAAVAGIVVVLSATGQLWDTGAGAVVWIAVLAGAVYMLYLCWQRYRSYA